MRQIEIQGRCLVNVPASERIVYMRAVFDDLSSEERAALAESRFNICAACFKDAVMSIRNRGCHPREIVSEMERKIALLEEAGL